MDSFKMKNELGIEFEYTVVAHRVMNEDKYIIYIDFVLDKNGSFRLFAGKIENNKVVRLESQLESYIINEFNELKESYVNGVMEGIE